jgi:hypothetical protein
MPRVIPDIERALSAVGELLSVEGKRVHVVIVGGAALNLLRIVQRSTRDVDLPPDWLNTDVAGQWETGLPRGLERRVHWHSFAGLKVGVVDRRDLIFFKLYAATDDRGPQSVHYQDLLALRPTEAELAAAARWVRRQDPSPAFAHELGGLLEHVRRHAR